MKVQAREEDRLKVSEYFLKISRKFMSVYKSLNLPTLTRSEKIIGLTVV